jgi:hypothetical protein
MCQTPMKPRNSTSETTAARRRREKVIALTLIS